MIPLKLFIYSYNCIILIFIYIYIYQQKTINNKSTHYYLLTTASIIIVQLCESLAWLFNNNLNRNIVFFNAIFTYLSYLFSALPILFFFLYLDSRIFLKQKTISFRRNIYVIYFLFYFLIVTINLKYGYLYNIDILNRYSRKIGMLYVSIVSVSLLGIYILSILRKLKFTEGRVVSVFLLFSIFPILGLMLQITFYGLPGLWSFFTLLILFTFIVIEREEVLKDSLTGLATRGQFEQRLRQRIKSKRSFTVLMIDLNDFKQVNDFYGHFEGDQALIIVSNILKISVKKIDLVCRYGGDEYMILAEADNKDIGNIISTRIHAAIESFNLKKVKPYPISLSIGSLYVDSNSNQDENEILIKVDELMYKQKENKNK